MHASSKGKTKFTEGPVDLSTPPNLYPVGELPWPFPPGLQFGGAFELTAQSLTWRMQKVGGAYAHASMKIVIVPKIACNVQGMCNSDHAYTLESTPFSTCGLQSTSIVAEKA